MTDTVWLRSHVERCMQHIWEDADLDTDVDGDYRFRSRTASGWIRVAEGRPPVVSVFAVAAFGVPRTGKLVKELNDINVRARTAHVVWRDDCVVVEQAMAADGVHPSTLEQAVENVSGMADDVGTLVAAVFGGTTAFPVELSDAD